MENASTLFSSHQNLPLFDPSTGITLHTKKPWRQYRARPIVAIARPSAEALHTDLAYAVPLQQQVVVFFLSGKPYLFSRYLAILFGLVLLRRKTILLLGLSMISLT